MCGLTKQRFSGGVNTMLCVTNPRTGNSNLLIGAGDGTIVYVNPQLVTVGGLKTVLMGGITSLSLHKDGQRFLAGTKQCNRYEVSIDLAEADMRASCHYGRVNDVCYPEGCPDLIVSSSVGDIRIWNVKIRQELLRIQVPNLEALCANITPSGSTLVSGWDDGKIRAFFPESGRMKFVISDAHSEGVTALAIADNDRTGSWRIISGGGEGRVRIWNVTHSHRALVTSLKEHRGPVNSIKINKDSSQAITASSDGSCIVWDLERWVLAACCMKLEACASLPPSPPTTPTTPSVSPPPPTPHPPPHTQIRTHRGLLRPQRLHRRAVPPRREPDAHLRLQPQNHVLGRRGWPGHSRHRRR